MTPKWLVNGMEMDGVLYYLLNMKSVKRKGFMQTRAGALRFDQRNLAREDCGNLSRSGVKSGSWMEGTSSTFHVGNPIINLSSGDGVYNTYI